MLSVYCIDRLGIARTERQRASEAIRPVYCEEGAPEGYLLARYRRRSVCAHDRVAVSARRASHDVRSVRGRHDAVSAVPEGDDHRRAAFEAGDDNRAGLLDSRCR